MSDILVALLIAIVFAAVWSTLYQLGGLDWLLDARMASARRMLAASKYAFDGEVHAVAVKPAAGIVAVRAKPARSPATVLAPA
jgi:hypothetical protein